MVRSKRSRIHGTSRDIIQLMVRYVKLEAVDKLSVAATFLIVSLVLFALGVCALFFLCSGLVIDLGKLLGSESLANYLVGGVLVVIMVVFYMLRVRIVENVVVGSISAGILKSGDGASSDVCDDYEDEDDYDEDDYDNIGKGGES